MSAGAARDAALGILGLAARDDPAGRRALAAIRAAVGRVERWLEAGDAGSPYARLTQLAMRLAEARARDREDLPAAAAEAERLIADLALILDVVCEGRLDDAG